MCKCVNHNCDKDPFDNELKMVLANTDGDFACCEQCYQEYIKQRNEFFNNIMDDMWYKNWMGI